MLRATSSRCRASSPSSYAVRPVVLPLTPCPQHRVHGITCLQTAPDEPTADAWHALHSPSKLQPTAAHPHARACTTVAKLGSSSSRCHMLQVARVRLLACLPSAAAGQMGSSWQRCPRRSCWQTYRWEGAQQGFQGRRHTPRWLLKGNCCPAATAVQGRARLLAFISCHLRALDSLQCSPLHEFITRTHANDSTPPFTVLSAFRHRHMQPSCCCSLFSRPTVPAVPRRHQRLPSHQGGDQGCGL
jgi:hypothetical protein